MLAGCSDCYRCVYEDAEFLMVKGLLPVAMLEAKLQEVELIVMRSA
jgi:hypothetical protein